MSTSLSFTIGLSDDGDDGSAFHLKNAPGEMQRQRILDRGSDLIVQGDLVTVIHGKYTAEGPPATLIIAEFRFLSADNSRDFRQATITFKFSHPQSKDLRCPEVVAIAPVGDTFLLPNYLKICAHHMCWRTQFDRFSMNPTNLTEEVKHTANLSTEAKATVGVGVSGGVGWELTRTIDKKDCGTLIGAIRAERRSGGPAIRNTARWALAENRSQHDGLPSYLRTAILLKRKDNEKFQANINVQADVNVAYAIENSLRNFLGQTVDPVYFDPYLNPMVKLPLDVDPNNLSALKIENIGTVRSTTLLTMTVGR